MGVTYCWDAHTCSFSPSLLALHHFDATATRTRTRMQHAHTPMAKEVTRCVSMHGSLAGLRDPATGGVWCSVGVWVLLTYLGFTHAAKQTQPCCKLSHSQFVLACVNHTHHPARAQSAGVCACDTHRRSTHAPTLIFRRQRPDTK